jgi:crotonobetainyl-CoA:carnitine CoA-transferase CaiB-like acyl-CoA transferase
VFFGIQNEREWASFCDTVMANTAFATDPRFSSGTQRVANRGELHAHIDAVFGALTKAEVLSRLDEAAIANAELRDMRSFSAHPQLSARERWRDVALPGGSQARSLLPPVTAQSYEAAMGAVPSLGEHTSSVLREFGISD